MRMNWPWVNFYVDAKGVEELASTQVEWRTGLGKKRDSVESGRMDRGRPPCRMGSEGTGETHIKHSHTATKV